MAPTH